jgi:hypothetical protein
LKRLFLLAALVVAPIGLLGIFGGVATADTISPNPITFDSNQGYTVGSINGQQGWSDTGGYDAQVVATSIPGFGDQSLQISDATTSGSFGDQTFAPGLTQPASETSNPYFTASFSIDTATATPHDGLHMSVSPDNGQGGRMSYLRFEYHASDGMVHVFFDDSSQSVACSPAGCANFTETDIAQFAPNTVHTFTFAIHLVPGTNSDGSPNDVVKIYEDSSTTPLITGTTWEGYYRYDPESGPTTPPPISTLLFREGGTANSADLGNGYLIDNMSMSSSACTPTGLMRDGINLTAALVNPSTVTGTVNASSCNIGVYYGPGTTGTVSGANISGANYFGVVADGAAVNVTGSNVHDIGEVPLNGSQHGNAIYYTNAAGGTISGNTVGHYQKNGITAVNGSSVTISGNTVTGEGPVNYIAQNGIEVGSGATGTVQDNTVSGNAYTGPNGASSGGVLVFGGPFFGVGVPYTTGVQVSHNTLTNNDVGIYLYNADLSGNAPKTQTKNGAVNNTITNNLDSGNSNKTGCSSTMGYQAGVSDFGTKDNIVNNKISGTGYTPATGTPVCTGTALTWKAPIDTSGVEKVHVRNTK